MKEALGHESANEHSVGRELWETRSEWGGGAAHKVKGLDCHAEE